MDSITEKMDELEQELAEKIKEIKPVDQKAIEIAKKRWDSIAHPLHSLGLLEDAIVAIAGIQKTPQVVLNKKCVAAFCADNGVVAQGVTQSGQEVTAIVTENFCSGQTSVCAMARAAGADVIPVDIGVAGMSRERDFASTKLPMERRISQKVRR